MFKYIVTIISTFIAMSPAPKQIFILSGQSNMSGRGGVSNRTWDRVTPPECSPSPSILRLTSDLKWVPAAEPLHADIDTNKTCGVGPGMAFANKVVSAIGKEEAGLGLLGLVPCAVGGTRIVEWEKGMDLYESMVRRGRKAKEGGGAIKAVLWFQGESDCLTKEDAELYKPRMERLVEDLRGEGRRRRG